jgi:hypothetical protein
MKPTAVEFAVEQLEQLIPFGHQLAVRIILEQAKEMEKQQIIDAYDKGCNEINLYYEFIKDENITQTKEPFSAEQYYNETFNK